MGLRHPEWRNDRHATKYPFADHVSLSNRDGTVFIPNTLFVDAALHPIGAQQTPFLSHVIVESGSVQLVLSDDQTRLASCTLSSATPDSILLFADDFGRSAGLLVADPSQLPLFQAWPEGTHEFTREAAEFVATCCLPLPEIAVRGFLLDDGSVIAGDAWIVGDVGVVLTAGSQELPLAAGGSEVARTLRVDVVGDPLFRRRLCTGTFFSPRFLRSLTVQHGCTRVRCGPDDLGNISITNGERTVDSVLRLRPTAQGLLIEAIGEALA